MIIETLKSLWTRYDVLAIKCIKELVPYLVVYTLYYCIGFELAALTLQVFICTKLPIGKISEC